MRLIQRLGNDITDEYIDSYIENIKKHDGSCDEVWFATEYGFPPMEKHEQVMLKIKNAAKKFRNEKIKVSLQLSNSIGHGEYMSRKDCSGLVYDGSLAEKMVGADGAVADYCFCWRGKHFEEYLIKELEVYAQIQPDCIWIDDDFRASNHAPVRFGCFCNDCMDKFNKKYSYNFNREQLVSEFMHGSLKVREDYVEFLRDGLGQLMYKMGETIHKVSENTALGLQYCAHGAYTGYGYSFIFDAMKSSTGHIPMSRPGGGAYDDHDPNEFLKKAVFMNWTNSMLPEYVECKCPEIENLPFVAFGKSPAGTAFETSYYFANGSTDMSYSMIMHTNEPMQWHNEEFELFSKHRKYWEKLSEVNRSTYQSGLNYFMSKEIWKKQLAPNETMEDLNREDVYGAMLLLRDAIPISFDRDEQSIILLHPEAAKDLSEKEIQYLLGKNVITDGESVEILKNKGADIKVTPKKISESDVLKISEKLTQHIVNPKGLDKWESSFFVKGKKETYYFSDNETDAEVLGKYIINSETVKTQDPNIAESVAEVIINTACGGKWAVLGYAPWKGIISSRKRDQILNAADYISNNALPARLNTPFQAVLLPRKNKDNRTAMVSVTNCTVGKSGVLELLIRKPAGEKFVFMSQNSDEIELEYIKNGDDYILKVPSIDAWSVGTVFCENN